MGVEKTSEREKEIVLKEVSVESPAVVEEQKAELENILRDVTEEKTLLEEKDCVAADPSSARNA